MLPRKLTHPAFMVATLALAGALNLAALLLPGKADCAQWRVVPARIFYDGDSKSTVITVVNEGDEAVNLQVQAKEWSQDAEGKDVYQDTGDIIFFPRILQIEKGQQRLIRTGIKMAAPSVEKTYRLFIEEIPKPKKSAADNTQLTVAVRFGVPVFVKPAKEELKGEIGALTLEKGVASAGVKNTGNGHFRITEVTVRGRDAKGEETFASKLNGWYLLAGARRAYTTPVPQDKCSQSKRLTVTVATDSKVTISRDLDVEKAQCQ